MTADVIVTRDERIMQIRMHRPDKKNALTPGMFGAMAQALRDAEADGEVRVVLITGDENAFTAGADLREFLERPPLDPDSPVQQFLRALSVAAKPLVAAVTGPAVGVGTTMLLHCDLVVAGKGARFALPFVDLALVPEAASSLLLPRLIGHRRASEHFLLGEPFDAETALHYGLVNRVVADVDAVETARDLARRIAAKPPEAVRLTKRLLRGESADAVPLRMLEESRHFAAQLKSAEFADAVQRFFAKPPR